MGKTVVRINSLTPEDIDNAIKEVKKYEKDFKKKCDELCKRIAERLSDEITRGFTGAIVDDLTEKSGGARLANVKVIEPVKREGKYIVTAKGKDAVWVEFGAGVHYNGSVGSSPNPYGLSLNFTIGGFGTQGTREVWGFYENGELKITKGTPASMPMYKAVQIVIKEIDQIAKEVFG